MIDTNVFVRALLARAPTNPNQQVLRLWLVEKRLQLIVSDKLVDEYLGVFRDVLGLEDTLVSEWDRRFRAIRGGPWSTWVEGRLQAAIRTTT